MAPAATFGPVWYSYVWDLRTGRLGFPTSAEEAHRGCVWLNAPKGGWILEQVLDHDPTPSQPRPLGYLKLRNVLNPSLNVCEIGLSQEFLGGAFSPDGTMLAIVYRQKEGDAGILSVWDVAHGRWRYNRQAPHMSFTGTVFISNDGKYLAASDEVDSDSHTVVYDLESGNFLRRLPGYPQFFDPTSRRLVTWAGRYEHLEKSKAFVWDMTQPEPLVTLLQPGTLHFFAKDGDALFESSERLYRIEIPGGSRTSCSPGMQPFNFNSLWCQWSGDRSRVLLRDHDSCEYVLFDGADGRRLFTFPSSNIGLIQLAPDGFHLQLIRNDDRMEYWERRHPETSVGVLALPELWVGALAAIALIWSLVASRRLRKI